MIKQYPQTLRVGKANLCHSDSPRSRNTTQANQNFSLTCYRCLAKDTLFLDVHLELREAMDLSMTPELSVAVPPSYQKFLLPTPLGNRKSSFSVGENEASLWKEGEREQESKLEREHAS